MGGGGGRGKILSEQTSERSLSGGEVGCGGGGVVPEDLVRMVRTQQGGFQSVTFRDGFTESITSSVLVVQEITSITTTLTKYTSLRSARGRLCVNVYVCACVCACVRACVRACH